jgi:hypothetical protein
VKRPRTSIAMLMVFVVLAALNFLVARLLLDFDAEILAAIAPGGLTLQLALVQVIRRRHALRAFWAGFIAGLIVTAALCAWGMARDRRTISRFDPSLGKRVVVSPSPGAPLWPWWPSYRRLAYQTIVSFPGGRALLDRYDLTAFSVLAVVFFLPQLLVALVAGLLALFIALTPRMLRFRPRPSRRFLFRSDH